MKKSLVICCTNHLHRRPGLEIALTVVMLSKLLLEHPSESTDTILLHVKSSVNSRGANIMLMYALYTFFMIGSPPFKPSILLKSYGTTSSLMIAECQVL